MPTEKIAAVPVDAAAAALLPATVKDKGTLIAGSDPTYPPFELYANDNKTLIGLEVDFANAIGQSLGLTVDMVPATFDAILPGLDSGKYDLGVSGFSITPERVANADFVAYRSEGSALAVPPGNPKDLSMSAMSLCGLKIGGQKGTVQGLKILPEFSKECTDTGKEAIDIQLFPTQSEANLALSSGRVDGISTGSAALGYAALRSGGAFELAEGDNVDTNSSGIALPKDSPLTPAISAAVKSLIQSPTYSAILTKWGLTKANMITVDQVDTK